MSLYLFTLGAVLATARLISYHFWAGYSPRERGVFMIATAAAGFIAFLALGRLPQPQPYWVLFAWALLGVVGWFIPELFRHATRLAGRITHAQWLIILGLALLAFLAVYQLEAAWSLVGIAFTILGIAIILRKGIFRK